MTPNGITARPSFISMPGMMVCIGRLLRAMQLGCPRSTRKPKPRFCSMTPELCARMPLPKFWNSELMKLHALPSLSTTQR